MNGIGTLLSHDRWFSRAHGWHGGLKFIPKSVQQPHPPFIICGNTPAALRRAAGLGDGWYGIGRTIAKARELVSVLREAER